MRRRGRSGDGRRQWGGGTPALLLSSACSRAPASGNPSKPRAASPYGIGAAEQAESACWFADRDRPAGADRSTGVGGGSPVDRPPAGVTARLHEDTSRKEQLVTAVRVRELRESDCPALIHRVDDWWGRPVSSMLPRLFLRHLHATSLAAVGDSGERVGFLVGIVSPSEPGGSPHPLHRGLPGAPSVRSRPEPVRAVLRTRPGAELPNRHRRGLPREHPVPALPSVDGFPAGPAGGLGRPGRGPHQILVRPVRRPCAAGDRNRPASEGDPATSSQRSTGCREVRASLRSYKIHPL